MGLTESCGGDEWLHMGGGGRTEEGTNNDPETAETGGAGRSE